MYIIKGIDNKEYGPASFDDVCQWIKENRANARTLARTENMTEFKPLSEFPEFSVVLNTGSQSYQSSSPWAPETASTEKYQTKSNDFDQLVNSIKTTGYDLDIANIIKKAFDLVISDFLVILGVTLLINLLLLVTAYIPLGFLLNGPLLGGLYYYFLKRIRGQTTELSDVFAGFNRNFLHLVLSTIVMSILIFLGFLFCILPGIYLAVAWAFTVPLIVDKQIDFWSAMEASRKIVTLRWFKVFIFSCILLVPILVIIFAELLVLGTFIKGFLINPFLGITISPVLLGLVIICAILSLCVLPFVNAAFVLAYEEIFNKQKTS